MKRNKSVQLSSYIIPTIFMAIGLFLSIAILYPNLKVEFETHSIDILIGYPIVWFCALLYFLTLTIMRTCKKTKGIRCQN